MAALEGASPEIGRDSILKLLDTIDEYIPEPVRDLDKPFMLPVERTHAIQGRGTVVTGKVERGLLKKGDEVQILGFDKDMKTTIAGIEMFKQILDGKFGWLRSIETSFINIKTLFLFRCSSW